MRYSIPLPGHYAVIEIKPEKMVTQLRLTDEVTLAEARAMPTKKYLVYLLWVSS